MCTLEKDYFGKPTHPDIQINPTTEGVEPRAWSNMVDGVEYWYYNKSAIELEAKYLGKTIATYQDWNDNWNSVGIKYLGYRYAVDSEFYYVGEGLFVGVADDSSDGKLSRVWILRDDTDMFRFYADPRNAMVVRAVSEKSVSSDSSSLSEELTINGVAYVRK